MPALKRILFLVIQIATVLNAFGQKKADMPRVIKLGVATGFRFTDVRFIVKPSQKLKIILSNTDDMSHNLLITKPGARLKVVEDALKLGDKGPSMSYIPKSGDVLWAIPVVGPNDTKSVIFTAPAKKGIYPYVCTIPGHGYIMYGAMYVSDSGILPDIKTDPNIPPVKNAGKTAHHPIHTTEVLKPLHPYTPVAPYLYRVFIEGASPAAIAVSLPKNISYCWDAAACNLRFAWEGGFLDNSDLWKGKGDAAAKIVGTIFFRDKTNFPFQTDSITDIYNRYYKGYRLVNRYPEFHYTIEGLDMYELIYPADNGIGLIRKFRISGAVRTLWFNTDENDGVSYTSSAGEWVGPRLKLSPQEAKQFSIIMTKKKAVK